MKTYKITRTWKVEAEDICGAMDKVEKAPWTTSKINSVKEHPDLLLDLVIAQIEEDIKSTRDTKVLEELFSYINSKLLFQYLDDDRQEFYREVIGE